MHLVKTVCIGVLTEEKRKEGMGKQTSRVWGPVGMRRALAKLNTWFTKRALCFFKTDGRCAHRVVKCSMKNGSSS